MPVAGAPVSRFCFSRVFHESGAPLRAAINAARSGRSNSAAKRLGAYHLSACHRAAWPDTAAECTLPTMSARTLILLAVFVVLLASCTTEPIADSETTPVPRERILAPQYLEAAPNTGAVAVKRDPGLFGVACRMRLLLDEQPVAELK